MSEAKRLLEQATPLPWRALIDSYEDGTMFLTAAPTQGQAAHVRVLDSEDAYLIEFAVNRLPDYEAAVEALEAMLNTEYSIAVSGHDVECNLVQTTGLPCSCGKNDALRAGLAALARLREGEAAHVK